MPSINKPYLSGICDYPTLFDKGWLNGFESRDELLIDKTNGLTSLSADRVVKESHPKFMVTRSRLTSVSTHYVHTHARTFVL